MIEKHDCERLLLDSAVTLATDLLGFKSFRRVDPCNVRLGNYWLGLSADESEWCLWECSLGDLHEPDGTLLEEFECPHQAMASLVGRYASDCYEQVAKAQELGGPSWAACVSYSTLNG